MIKAASTDDTMFGKLHEMKDEFLFLPLNMNVDQDDFIVFSNDCLAYYVIYVGYSNMHGYAKVILPDGRIGFISLGHIHLQICTIALAVQYSKFLH